MYQRINYLCFITTEVIDYYSTVQIRVDKNKIENLCKKDVIKTFVLIKLTSVSQNVLITSEIIRVFRSWNRAIVHIQVK